MGGQFLGDSSKPNEDYSPGLCLIETIYKQYEFPPGSGEMAKLCSEAIPKTSEFVHIAITGVKMIFGSADDPKYSELEGLLFEVFVKTPRSDLKKGKVEFNLHAHIAGQSSEDPWYGTLAMTIMCFGKCG